MPSEDPQAEWMTLEEVASFLRLSPSKLYEMAREGGIPCSKIAGRWRFSRSEIDAWARQQRPADDVSSAGEDEG